MNTFWQDLRYGARMLAKNPGFTLIAVLALALGIGANTAIFSVVNAVLLRPLPVIEPDRLIVAFLKVRGVNDNPVSYADFDDWRKQNQSFERMAAYFHRNLNFTGSGESERLRVATVTEDYFTTLGVQPSLGRGFVAAEHQPNANLVAVLSHGFWQRRLGGAPNIIGQIVRLDGKSYTVVGVMPPQTPSLGGSARTEIWIPLEPNVSWRRRGLNFLIVLGRLRPGVSVERAQSDMNVIAERLAHAYPQNNTGAGIRLVALERQLFGDLRAALLALLAAVVFVLLIAVANVASLLLTRATERSREFAVRLALGAGRLRIMRQLLTESILLAFVGGILGVGLAIWAVDLILVLWPAKVARPDLITIDWRVLGFTAGVTLITGIFFGLTPAWQATRTNLGDALKEDSSKTTTGVGRSRLRSLFVVSEIALATMLLLGAALMLKSFWLLQHVRPGFNPENVLSVQISLPASKYSEDHQVAAFFAQTLESVAALPGVQAVGAVNNLPLAGGGMSGNFRVEGQTFPEGQEPETEKYIVSENYFRTMGIPLLKGRLFTEQDVQSKPEVVIISEAMARRFWPNEDPLGKHIAWGDNWQEIVGVVGDVKHEGLEAASGLQSYRPFLQFPSSGVALVIRTTADPLRLVTAIKDRVRAVDHDQPIYNVRTLEQVVADSIAGPRMSAFLLGIFAALALVLAAVGLYGVMSYVVACRTHEIGIRMALGAQARHVLKLVVGQGMILAVVGVAIGLAGAFALTRVLANLLFNVTPTDPATFVIIALLLMGVALLACYIPARRATKVDPMIALRCE